MPDKKDTIPTPSGQPTEHTVIPPQDPAIPLVETPPLPTVPPTDEPVRHRHQRLVKRPLKESRPPVQDNKVARAIAKHTKVVRTEKVLDRDKASLTNMVQKLSQEEQKLYQEGIKQK